MDAFPRSSELFFDNGGLVVVPCNESCRFRKPLSRDHGSSRDLEREM